MSETIPQEPTLSQAMNELAAIEQRMQQEGSVDSELDQIKQIRTDLTAGTITPKEAIDRARSIVSSRQDYH